MPFAVLPSTPSLCHWRAEFKSTGVDNAAGFLLQNLLDVWWELFPDPLVHDQWQLYHLRHRADEIFRHLKPFLAVAGGSRRKRTIHGSPLQSSVDFGKGNGQAASLPALPGVEQWPHYAPGSSDP